MKLIKKMLNSKMKKKFKLLFLMNTICRNLLNLKIISIVVMMRNVEMLFLLIKMRKKTNK